MCCEAGWIVRSYDIYWKIYQNQNKLYEHVTETTSWSMCMKVIQPGNLVTATGCIWFFVTYSIKKMKNLQTYVILQREK